MPQHHQDAKGQLHTTAEAFARKLAGACYLPPQYAKDIEKVCWCLDRDPFTTYKASRMQNQTVCEGKLLYPVDSELPDWMVRALGEMTVGDLAVSIDGKTTYRLDYGINSATDPATMPVSYVPCPRVSTALRAAKNEQNSDVETLIKQTLYELDRIIVGGITWHCSDGEIKAVYYGDPDNRAWTVAYRQNDEEWQGLTPNARTEADTCGLPEEAFRTLQYPTIGGRDARTYTVVGMLRKWRNARDCIRAGCADKSSARNLLMTLGAPYLRDHAEVCSVIQGPGGVGKSTLIRDLMNEGYPTSNFVLALDTLANPSSLAAENAMYDLAGKLLAVCDDYEPKNWPAVIAKLKPILTGILPFSPRKQGENAMTDVKTAQSFIVITTNCILPLAADTAQQRRFAFATLATEGWWKSYLAQKSVLTFEPFLLASAVEWAAAQGRFVRGVPQYASNADISATLAGVIMTIHTEGCVTGDELRHANITAKSLGLVRKHATAAYCKQHGLNRDTTFVYCAPKPGTSGYAIWAPQLAAVKSSNARDEYVEPIPDGSNVPEGLDSVGAWSDVLAQAGARTALLPCLAHDSGKNRAKAPDARLLKQLTDGITSWLQMAKQMPDACRPHLDASDAWGMTLLDDRYVWLDLDCHASDRESGWSNLQDAVGPYGSDALPRTFMVRTPSGGVHCLYQLPAGRKLSNHVNADWQVDLRTALQGYVLAGGSKVDAGVYKPVDVPADIKAVPVMSDALYEWLLSTTRNGNQTRQPHAPAAAVPTPASRQAWHGRGPFDGMDMPIFDTDPGIQVDGVPFRLHPPVMQEHAVHDPMCRWFYGLAQKAAEKHLDDAVIARLFKAACNEVPSWHDPDDTLHCVQDACSKAGIPCPII